ncbi:MAG TPA: hypothetical protein VFB45_10555 [Pseudolabrys sp.]|nr:hypothetical protein [Pseudolabrys sp.]
MASAFNLDALIAQGPPTVNFSPLSNLLGNYMAGRDLRNKFNLQNALQNQSPSVDGQPDWLGMARTAIANGDYNAAVKFAAAARWARQPNGASDGVSAGAGATVLDDGSLGPPAMANVPTPQPRPATAPSASSSTAAAEGSTGSTLPQIPISAVQMLRAAPHLADQFDDKFGDGMADLVMGGSTYA